MLNRVKVIGIKTEAAQNTPGALAATDFLHCFDIEVNHKPEILERLYNTPSIDRYSHLIGKKTTELKFKTHPKGSGAAGTAHVPLGAAIQSCGYSETITPATNVVYAPLTNPAAGFFGPGKSSTIKLYEGNSAAGILHVLAGAIGSFRRVYEAGQMPVWEFSFMGLYTAVADAAFPATTPLGNDPAKVAAATLSIHAYAAIAAKLEMDIQNEIALKDNINAAEGVGGFQITGRNPLGSLDPEAVTVATHDFFAKMMSGTEAAASIVIGATPGNIITESFPKVQYGEITPGDRNGIQIFNLPIHANRNAGDDWNTITFT